MEYPVNTTMRAVVLSEPGGVDKLVVKDVPIPRIEPLASTNPK
jgi:hypothetical protein